MWILFIALFAQASAPAVPKAAENVIEAKATRDAVSSARCVAIASSSDERVAPEPKIAPGPPPALSFRYYEGQLHHRFENMNLVLDDAGH